MSRLLDGLPPLATTGVGSLPFERPAGAARHALEAYGLPFCPQLPRLDGDMIAEWLGADPGRCGWAPDRDRERPAAWHEVVGRLTAKPPEHGVVKLQVTGPVTLAIALERSAGRRPAGGELASLAGDIAVWLAANVAGQVRRLGQVGLHALVVVDEPGLAGAGVGPAEAALWDPLRAAAPAWGMHICGPVPWDLIDALELDLVSLDVTRHGVPPQARPVLTAMLRRGARVAWGILDPVTPTSAADAAGMGVAALSALADSGTSIEQVARRSLLTPGCGTGRLSPERERLVAASLSAAAHAIEGAIAARSRRRSEDARRGGQVRSGTCVSSTSNDHSSDAVPTGPS
jgi:hypothetical protein